MIRFQPQQHGSKKYITKPVPGIERDSFDGTTYTDYYDMHVSLEKSIWELMDYSLMISETAANISGLLVEPRQPDNE